MASKFAYGQALTVKHNEFEKATAVQQVIEIDGRKMSAESLGHSGKILSTSPLGSDIDETEISSPKGPFVPLFNKQNIALN